MLQRVLLGTDDLVVLRASCFSTCVNFKVIYTTRVSFPQLVSTLTETPPV